MNAESRLNDTPLLLLLDGVLCQDEQSAFTALEQIQKLDPTFYHLQCIESTSSTDQGRPGPRCKSPLRSASALEGIVERLLTIKPQLVRVASESDGSLPLHFAASIGNVKVASLLLNHYQDAAFAHNTKGKTPLHYAAREGRVAMVRFLLRSVPRCATMVTKRGKLALHFASGEGHVEVVRDLLTVHPSGASFPSQNGKVALHFAARWGHTIIARDLCQIYPASIHTLDYDGSNPLHDATREGQFETAKFLVEQYPPTLCVSNIWGEIPLFTAIRSGNVTLCAFLISSWPESGKQVLRSIKDSDDISSWEPAVLNLCLRGAVANFTDLSRGERGYAGDAIGSMIDRASNRNILIDSVHPPHQQFSERYYHGINDRSDEESFASPQQHPSESDVLLPRSKSPILESDDSGEKIPLSDRTYCKKRQRCESIDNNQYEEGGREEGTLLYSYEQILETTTFYQVHAALECSASTKVLKYVLERYPEQRSLQDDYGRLPLHIGLSHCRSRGSVDVILEHIWKPHEGACFIRDYFGRLPLHLALMTRADTRFIRVLLDANPSSGVEQCQIVNLKFSHMLPIHLATLHGCDLTTLFMLVRQDPTVVEAWHDLESRNLL